MSVRRKSAFTLVELLVVIGIIGVLIAILLPVLGKAAEAARQIKCASNERQIYMSLEMYSGDNKGILPIPPLIGQTNSWFMFPCPTTGVIDYTSGVLWPYLEPSEGARFDVYNCPTDLDTVRLVRLGNVFITPRNFSYSFNVQMINVNGMASDSGIRWTDIIHPAQKVLIVEEQWPNDGCAFINGAGDEDDIFTNRHNLRGNQGFADGHIECLNPADFGFDTNGVIVNTVQNSKTCDLYAE